jgi:hypothetical protein
MHSLLTSILFLLVLLLFAGIGLLFTHLRFLRQHVWQILILIVVSLVCLLPSDGRYFMGLEYEDAYVYTASSRYLLFHQDFSVEPLQTQTCVLGSMADCITGATYGGHFVTLPAIAYFIHRLLGYHPYTVCGINYAASLISVLILYFLCLRLTGGDVVCSLVAALVYAICPAMCLFHTSALAETTSSLFLLIYVSCFLSVFLHKECSRGISQWLLWTLLGVSLGLALLTKRENLVLLTLPLLALPAMSLKWSREAKGLLVWAGITVALAVLIMSGFKILHNETGESRDIGASTFSFRYSLVLVPLFCRALLTFKWFSISTVLFLCGVAAMCRRSIRHSGWIVVGGLFFAYFFVYTGHYRSFYFVHFGTVRPFESLRYITNAFPLFAAVTGLGTNEIRCWGRKIGGWWRGYDRFLFGGIATVWVLSSVGMTRSLRKEWQEVEWENRIAPVVSTLQNVNANQDYVVTNLSMVFQVFGASTVRIVDQYSVGAAIPSNVLVQSLKEAQTVWWLRHNGTDDEDMERYPGFYQFIRQYDLRNCARIPGPFSLCRLIVR